MVAHYYWTEVQTDRLGITQNLTTVPIQDDFHVALRGVEDAHWESHWWPRVDVLVTVNAGSPVPQWWIGARVVATVVMDSDQSFPLTQVGDNDARHLGFVALQPVIAQVNSAGDHVVTWKAPEQGLRLRSRRKGTSISFDPQVLLNLYAFDHFNVFQTGSNTHVNIAYSCTSRVLWESQIP